MRLPLLSAAVVLLPVSSLAAQLLAPQVYLHPSPHDGQTASPPALSDDEAHTVIAHHLGATKGHLLPALGDWVHMLTGSAAVAPESAKPKILVVQGVVDADDFISKPPTFTLSSSHFSDLLAPYLHRASTFLTHALASISDNVHLPKFLLDAFDLSSSEASHALKQELEALSSWVDGFIEIDDSGSEEHEAYEALSVQGLEQIDRGSEEYNAAVGVVQGSIASMTASQTPFILILTPPSVDSSVRRRSLISSHQQAPVSSLKLENASYFTPGPVYSVSECLTSFEACTNATDSCSGRGTCGETKRGAKSCWTCSCGSEVTEDGKRTQYAGAACEKVDLSQPFILLVFTVIFLLLLIVGSIALLYTVGNVPLPSVLAGGTVGPIKRD